MVMRPLNLLPTVVLSSIMTSSNTMVPVILAMRNAERNAVSNESPPIGESLVIRTIPPKAVKQIESEDTKDAMSSSPLLY